MLDVLINLLALREPMNEVENFTIFIKNSIRFPLFNVTRWVSSPIIKKLQKSFLSQINLI